jgi:UDP-glucose-4-epimerase GalE
MNILVVGGAGYIGSHMCKLLNRAGHTPIVFDNLSTGHEKAVKWGPFFHGDILDSPALDKVFSSHRIDTVMHFAARSQVAESVREPALYLRNNVVGTLSLLEAMRRAGAGRLVFSSTAAVYGDPECTPVDEVHRTLPVNPYGWSKLMAERAIAEYCDAYPISAVSLRYFNAAGADSEGEIGEAHEPETHLIPNVINAAFDPALGPVKIFGNDYPTPDGTCVRDYVHVEDLCDAHLRAVAYLENAPGFSTFNLGSGRGSSVAEVLAACRLHCNGMPEAEVSERRPGDPAILVASRSAAERSLGWRPVRTLSDCLETAIRWHCARLQEEVASSGEHSR